MPIFGVFFALPRVAWLCVFGSAAREKIREGSDVVYIRDSKIRVADACVNLHTSFVQEQRPVSTNSRFGGSQDVCLVQYKQNVGL